MELTPFVKKYIEDNHELLDKDFHQFVDSFSGSKQDFKCFLSILQDVLKEYTDLDSKIKEYNMLLQEHTSNLRKKYIYVAGMVPFVRYWNDQPLMSADQLIGTSLNISVAEDGSIPNALPQELSYSLKAYHGNVVLKLEDKARHSSADFVFALTFTDYSDYFGLSELYTQKKLPTILNKLEDLYRDIDSKFDDCVKSIQWKIEAEKIAQKLVDRMNSYDSTLEDSPLRYHCGTYNNAYFISNYDLSRKTKIDLSMEIPFDSDPNLTDWDIEFKNWTKKVDKFKQNQEKVR